MHRREHTRELFADGAVGHRRRLHLQAEDAAGVARPVGRQLFLEAANPAHFVDKPQVSSEPPA